MGKRVKLTVITNPNKNESFELNVDYDPSSDELKPLLGIAVPNPMLNAESIGYWVCDKDNDQNIAYVVFRFRDGEALGYQLMTLDEFTALVAELRASNESLISQ
jgi:hypothetical protein